MEKVLVAGASGTLGLEIIKALHSKHLPIRALIHHAAKASSIKQYTDDIVLVDARKPNQLMGIFRGVGTVISTIGKSVSLFKGDQGTYDSIDYLGNKNLLEEAHRAGVKRVIYTSIMGSGPYNPLKLARVHFRVEQIIIALFNSYTIIRPTGFFSGLHDWVVVGKRGIIPVIGDGQSRTNSIYQGDLADYILEVLEEGPPSVEIGGRLIHTRMEMAKIVQKKTGAKILRIPHIGVKGGIAPLRLLRPSLYHNLDYFRYVCTRDMVGEKHGTLTFQQYIDNLDLSQLP